MNRIDETASQLVGYSPANIDEKYVPADVPKFAALDMKKIKKATNNMINEVNKFIKNGGGKYTKLSRIIGFYGREFLKYLNGTELPPYRKTTKGTGKQSTKDIQGKNLDLEIKLHIYEELSEPSIVMNGYYMPLGPQKHAVNFVIGVPSQIVDMGKLPKYEEEKLRKHIPYILIHETAHAQDFGPSGALARYGRILKRLPALAYHTAREFIRKGIPSTASRMVGYFRMQDEFNANVAALRAIAKANKGRMNLLTLLKTYGEAFNNIKARDALITAYYDDRVYRKKLMQELKKAGVKVTESVHGRAFRLAERVYMRRVVKM